MNSKKLILYTVLFLASFVSFAQNSEKKEKSAARRFADSLYYVHSIKPQQKQQQKQEENAKIDLSKTKDAKTNVFSVLLIRIPQVCVKAFILKMMTQDFPSFSAITLLSLI